MNKESPRSLDTLPWKAHVIMLASYAGYMLVALISLAVFGHYALADRYGASDEAVRRVNITSAILLLATFVSIAVVNKLVIAALTSLPSEASYRARRGFVLIAVGVSVVLIISNYTVALWHYNLH